MKVRYTFERKKFEKTLKLSISSRKANFWKYRSISIYATGFHLFFDIGKFWIYFEASCWKTKFKEKKDA